MPELPEVEITRRGIAQHLEAQKIARVVVRQPQLRWPVPVAELRRHLPGEHIKSFERRAKYLVLRVSAGSVIMHLGMSGSLRVLPAEIPPGKHDHFDLVLHNGQCLRLRDPRRFGAILWTADDPLRHKLLAELGPEPLTRDFNGAYLHQVARGSKRRARDFLLDGGVVSGVGNIYANEALFSAGIRPQCAAGKISRARCDLLARAIKRILQRALRAGGTTLRDFQRVDGQPGYFRLQLAVYDRAGQPCRRCRTLLRQQKLGARSAYYCPQCQL